MHKSGKGKRPGECSPLKTSTVEKQMNENVTNELVLEHLKRLQSGQSQILGRLDAVEAEMRSVKSYLGTIKHDMATLIDASTSQDATIATLRSRLDRIERRLDLTETPRRPSSMNPLRYYLPFTGYAYRGELSGCPVCTEKDSRPVAQLDRNWKRLPTVMCNHCGVLYTNPLPTESELGRFYKESYRRLYHRTLRRPRIKHIAKAAKIAQSRVKLTSGMCQPGGRVLDFGCGTGAFVEKMLEAGYDAHGFEIGDSYGGYAREQVGNRIQISDWRQMHYSQEFDLITAFHVVEHLRDPLGAVKKMKSWLAPGGRYS